MFFLIGGVLVMMIWVFVINGFSLNMFLEVVVVNFDKGDVVFKFGL